MQTKIKTILYLAVHQILSPKLFLQSLQVLTQETNQVFLNLLVDRLAEVPAPCNRALARARLTTLKSPTRSPALRATVFQSSVSAALDQRWQHLPLST